MGYDPIKNLYTLPLFDEEGGRLAVGVGDTTEQASRQAKVTYAKENGLEWNSFEHYIN